MAGIGSYGQGAGMTKQQVHALMRMGSQHPSIGADLANMTPGM